MLRISRWLTQGVVLLGAMSLSGLAVAQSSCPPGSQQLVIYHAGSLTAAFTPVEKLLTQKTGICVIDVAAGSVDAARRVTAGQEPCDIYASADYEVIDLFLKPARYADFNILFAKGAMVLAYTTASKNAALIASPDSPFAPPMSIPDAANDWYTQVLSAGVTVGGSHPFLDPSGYRADMIFQLTQEHYRVANLYDLLLDHYSINKASDALGKTYDYQFIYEHSALAAYNADPTKTYRYVRLPDDIGLSDPTQNRHYEEATVTMPGLGVRHTDSTVQIPATRVVWGLTILRTAPNPANAVKFLELLFGDQGVALQTAVGPAPISPPIASRSDYEQLPGDLKTLVRVRNRDH